MDRALTAVQKRFGENLKYYRKMAGLTQEQLAFRAELDRGYISGVERAMRNPTIVSADRIAHALGIEMMKLFEETVD
jgi:transcriptional regulator with XRE-family HTH domain